MAMEKPCCAEAAARPIRKLTLADGFQVGISNLEGILKDVADLKLADSGAVSKELLMRVRLHNYVPASAEDDYSQALFKEYRRQFGKSQ